ncbi:unnamed protein product [Effrenium voratum]|nr:unnamed protein product [Effrenium voratum]
MVFMADRLQVLACTILYLLGDIYVQRLCRVEAASERPYLGDELHEAALFLTVAAAFAVAGSRGAVMPVLWLIASCCLAVQWELRLAQFQAGQAMATCVQAVLVFLALWTLRLTCKCCCTSGLALRGSGKASDSLSSSGMGKASTN